MQNKPTYFKFFDNYVELLRTCETHKDRSLLLLAMFDYWDNGTSPELPKRLQDKWRFLHLSMKTSRKNAYAALERNGENTEENFSEIVETPLAFQPKKQNKASDNQQVNENTCARPAHEVSTYRIKNIEEKNREYENDRSIGKNDRSIGEEYPEMTNYSNGDDELDYVLKMIHSQPIDDKSSPYTNPSLKSYPESSPSPKSCSCSNQSESQYKPESHTKDELESTGAKVLERIVSLYRVHKRPVSYTWKKAGEELGVSKTMFFQVIRHLEATNQLHTEKYQLQEGIVVNTYTPTAVPTTPKLKLLGPDCILDYSKNPSVALTHYCLYFKDHPFLYDDSWGMSQFWTENATVIDSYLEDLSFVTTNRNSVVDGLWTLVKIFAPKGGLVDANPEKASSAQGFQPITE